MSTWVTDRTVQTTSEKTSVANAERFYTIGQIADRLEVSTRTVRRWIKNELLIAHDFSGLVRVSEADFQSFLAAHRAR